MRNWWRQARPTLALAVPIIIGQLGQMLMPLIDAAMVGRLGVTPLAAVAFGNLIVWIPMIAGFGICVSVHVLVASAHTANEREEASEVLRHGMAAGIAYGFVCSVLLMLGMNWLGLIPRVEPEVIAAARPFIGWIAWSIIPVLGYTALKNYCEAKNQPWVPLFVLTCSIALNAFLNWVLIYGNLGVPAMGAPGAGLATLVSRLAAWFVLLAFVQSKADLRASWPRGAFGRLSRERLRRMFSLGGPSAGQILFEVGVFNMATLLAGMLGKVVLDAHQIALNIAAVGYMVPLGLSQAAGIRVSQAVGAANYPEARRIGWNSLGLAAMFMASCAIFVLFARHALPRVFLLESTDEARQVIALSSKLLLWAAAFAIFDGTQITSLGILRGLRDVKTPTLISFTGYWLVAAPLAWYWGMVKGWGGPGVWAALALGVMVVGTLLVGRFAVIARRREREEFLAKPAREGI